MAIKLHPDQFRCKNCGYIPDEIQVTHTFRYDIITGEYERVSEKITATVPTDDVTLDIPDLESER